MSVTLETILAKVNELLLENQSLRKELSAVSDKVVALQVAVATKPVRRTASGSTAVGLNGAGEPVKPAANTLLWLKREVKKNPNYLAEVLTKENYDNMVASASTAHDTADLLKGKSPADFLQAITHIIWTQLGRLSKESNDPGTKTASTTAIAVMTAAWKAEKEAFNAKAAADKVTATILPDTPVSLNPNGVLPLVPLPSTMHLGALPQFSMGPLIIPQMPTLSSAAGK